ncbi:MAG: fused MFS/spermidine synthase [Nitrospiria bacterium]
MFALVPILFFLSGLTALLYQMVWMRELILVFGASMFAISTLLTAFMGGLALGSWFFGKRADQYANPLKTYGLLELGIGLYAFAVPVLFASLVPVYQVLSAVFDFSFYVFSLVRFVLAVLILLLPTALMGGTLPVLAQRYKNRDGAGKGVGLLYAFNTFGAVAGVLSAGFFLLPNLGLQKTTLLAAGLNGLIALVAIALGKRDAGETSDAQDVSATPKPAKKIKVSHEQVHLTQLLFMVFSVSGFSAMIYEVVWTRILTLILGSTVYSYATMLSTYLLGLALGSFLFSLLLKRFQRPLMLLTLVQAGIALFAFAGEFVFPLLPTIFLKIMAVLHTWSKVRAAAKFVISGAVMMIPTLLMGGVFPLVIHILTSREKSENRPLGSIVGQAYAVNTVGTIAGSFSVGFILLPIFGIQKSLHFAIMINVLLALMLWFRVSGREALKSSVFARSKTWATGGVFGFFAVMILSAPTWNPLMMSSELFGQQSKLNLLYYKEGISATVTVVQHQTLAKIPHLTLAIDGKPNASTTGDMKTQLLVAHLPMLFAPDPRNVMLIGHGSGITTGSMIMHPIEKLITLELEPAVIEGSRFFDPFSHNVLDDPRVSLVEDDARNYLLRTGERYDVIVSEPSHPWRSGSAKLFTKEFFQLGKEHLNPGGVFSQWIHFYGIRSTELKSVVKTFHSVFKEVMIFFTDAGDLIMLGSETPFNIDRKEMSRRISAPGVAADLARADVHSVYDLWAHFILGPGEVDRFVGDAVLNTDDFTLVEFQTPKSLFEDTMSIHIAEMRGAASAGDSYLFDSGTSEQEKADGFLKIADAFLRMGKLGDAGEMIQKALRLAPGANGEWLWGRAQMREGNRREAERAWLRALDHDAAHQKTLLSLAQLYQSQGAYKKASAYLSTIEEETMDGLKASYYKGVDLYFKGAYESALPFLQKGAVFSAPMNHYYESLTHERLGVEEESRRALGEFIVGLDDWRRELETDPKKFQQLPYWKNVEWRRKVGVQIPEEERMALLFERVVADPLKHLYGGAGLYLLGRYEAAAKNLEQGVEKLGRQAPGSLMYYYLGLSYQELGRQAEASQAFQSFLEKHRLDEGDIRVIEAKKHAALQQTAAR